MKIPMFISDNFKIFYGFFINLDMWNLLECNKLYKFNAPVTIKIIKICKDKKIRYYTSK